MAHHVVNLLRGEHGARLHLRHGAPQSHIVGRGGEPRNLRLVHALSAILDVRLRLVLTGRRKARNDGAHGGAAVLHSVVVHQHYPSPYAVLARFKLDETILRSRHSLPFRTRSDVKDVVLCNHNFFVLLFVNTKKVGQLFRISFTSVLRGDECSAAKLRKAETVILLHDCYMKRLHSTFWPFLLGELTEKQQKVLLYEIIVVFLQTKCRNNQFLISYACRLHFFEAMSEVNNLQDWVTSEMLRGRYIFTKEDVLGLHLPISGQSLQNSLKRLTNRGIIMSPWQNFYVIIPTEYKLRGIVPPSFYIDRLMKFLGRDYYVSLLSAAELNGAAHQKAMVFQTIVNGNAIRSGLKNGTRLEFTLRQNLPLDYTKKVKTQMGYMNVAGAELTALDIVAEEQKIGGLSRAAEILMELCETMQWDEAKLPLLAYFSGATIQRLGYLLELIEETGQADNLYSLFKQTVKTMRRTPLKQSVATSEDMVIDNRWKIIINYKIDTDEI